MPRQDAEHAVYQPPSCLAEARSARARLIESIADINTQLSNKNKRRTCTACDGSGADGNNVPCPTCKGRGGFRWTDHEYHEWRQRALTALRARESVLRRINSWVSDAEHREVALEQGASADTHDLVRKAHNLFLALAEDGVDYDTDEWQVVEELRAYLEPVTAQATG
jgi:hypothetical protein